jgi:hypothetical protein
MLTSFYSCNTNKKTDKEVNKKPIVTNTSTSLSNPSETKNPYQYDISGWVHITYQNKGLKDVSVKLINHENGTIKKINTDYDGKFSFKGSGNNLSLIQLSKWYILIEKDRYKTIKMPLTWVEDKGINEFINKHLNMLMDCAGKACMDRCCNSDEVCSHQHGEDGLGWSKCIRMR